jgi:hypothetical protein
MAFDRTVHHTVKTREGAQPGRTTPFVELVSAMGNVVIQNGQFMDTTGVAYEHEDIPEWALEAAKGLNEEACEDLGIPYTGKPKKPSQKTSAPVDIHASERGNPPMQLNAEGPDGEAGDKAEPVPQNVGADVTSPRASRPADPADAPPKPGVKVSKVDPSLVKKG